MYYTLISVSGATELRELTILRRNYSSFRNLITDANHLSAYFVDQGIITTSEVEEINSTARNSDRVVILLRYIIQQLEAQITDGFYSMLDIMEVHGLNSTQYLANRISNEVNSYGDNETLNNTDESRSKKMHANMYVYGVVA